LAYKAVGQHERALQLLEQVLVTLKAQLGLDHPDTLACINNLARTYWICGQHDRALPLQEQALAASKAKLGLDHPDTLWYMNDLAVTYWSAGKLARSIALFEETLPLRTTKLGKYHPGTIATLANLGVNYRDAGRLQEALPLLEDALGRAQKLKPFPASLQFVFNALAETYVRAGQDDRAESVYHQFLDRMREQFGADKRPIAQALAQFGLHLLKQKKYAHAEPLLRECLAIRTEKLPEDWSRFNAQSLLGGALLGQQKYPEAEPLLLQGYEGMKQRVAQIPAQGRSILPEAAERLVRLYEATNEPEKVRTWREKLKARESNAASTGSK
jgi:tetratricopeptide (TPR) repeat protein